MPNVSVFDDMSADEIARVDAEIERRNFKNLTAISEWCKSQGWEIERGAVWTRSSKLKKRLQTLKNATDASKLIEKQVQDEGGSLHDATLSIIQAGLFDCVTNLEEANDEDDPLLRVELLGKAARAAADVGRASISVKKYKSEVKAKAQSVAEKVAITASKNGLSMETVELLKREILGIAV
ncbi:MAG: DUF3486 family protein [Methylococcales bacterium]